MKYRFDAKEHKYFINEIEVPSVTQLLKIFGFINTSFYDNFSRDRGTAVHAACLYLDRRTLNRKTVHDVVEPYLCGYELFLKEHEVKWSLMEKPQYNSILMFGCTPDRKGVLDGKKAIIELKTGIVEYWVKLQLAGQAVAIDSENLCERRVLQLKSNGKYKLHDPFPNRYMDSKIFKSLCGAYYWKKNNEGRLQ